MEYKTTHESIASQEDKPFTPEQANYLAILYKDILNEAITPKSETSAQNEYMRFKLKFSDRCVGTLARHFYESFGVAQKLTKNTTSKLISDAKYNQKFDKKFAKAWITSNNKFLKEYRAAKAS
jgi:hypothetical protein